MYFGAKSNKKIKPRELIPIQSGAITSRNRAVGGESGRCENNKLNTLIYEYGPESWAYTKYLSPLTAEQYLWFFYDDPYTEPNTYTPGVSDPTEENAYSVIVIPRYKFTDNSKHDVLGVRVPANNNKGYIDYKIKFAPKTGGSEGLTPLWFYIEEYEGPGKPMRKKWGDLASSLSEEDHAVMYGDPNELMEEECPNVGNSFGKVNNDIAYLKSL